MIAEIVKLTNWVGTTTLLSNRRKALLRKIICMTAVMARTAKTGYVGHCLKLYVENRAMASALAPCP